MGSVLVLGVAQSQAAACGPTGPAVEIDLENVPPGPIAGYSGVQLVNAAYVMNAASALGMTKQAQTTGVMTAMGESSLIVVDHGDAAGPDSRGLFQQRDNGAWGTYEDRMDPFISSTNFFKALLEVEGWELLPPTIAAHRVQRNADPYYYEPFWEPAVEVVDTLAAAGVAAPPTSTGRPTLGPTLIPTGTPTLGPPSLPTFAPTGAPGACVDTPGSISDGGWTKPVIGPITSGFGWRRHPITGVLKLHTGTDLGAPCEAPIYAAGDGVVIQAGAASGYGNLIAIDHGMAPDGARLVSRYAHMFNSGVLVRVGEPVTAGAQIARVGTNGLSTGCHLHYEIRIGEEFVDPEPFMAARGAPLG